MFVQSLNFFSIITPLFMMSLAVIAIVWAYYQKFSNYFIYFLIAIGLVGLTQIFHSVITPEYLPQLACLISGIFFLGTVSITHSIHLRLKIPTRWSLIIVIILFSELLMFYFSIINDQYAVRMFLIAITASLIFGHNINALLKSQLSQRADKALRIFLILMIFIMIFRACLLYFLGNPTNAMFSNPLVWALSQFLVLLLSISMATIIISGSISEKIRTLKQERNVDPLTGLLNRRAFMENLRNFPVLKAPEQHAILLCDLDFFKHINDQYGHLVGDRVLQHIAEVLRRSIRYRDEISRFGGEEFVIILHSATLEQTKKIAERIRSQIADTPFRYEELSIDITISVGIGFFNDHEKFAEVLQDADQLLYQAKKYGRNNIQWQTLDLV